MDLRQTYNGFGDSLARAFELTLTPALFGFVGWLLDRWLGVVPLFTLVFALFTFGYVAWKLWGGYETAMRAHERDLGIDRQGIDRQGSDRQGIGRRDG